MVTLAHLVVDLHLQNRPPLPPLGQSCHSACSQQVKVLPWVSICPQRALAWHNQMALALGVGRREGLSQLGTWELPQCVRRAGDVTGAFWLSCQNELNLVQSSDHRAPATLKSGGRGRGRAGIRSRALSHGPCLRLASGACCSLQGSAGREAPGRTQAPPTSATHQRKAVAQSPGGGTSPPRRPGSQGRGRGFQGLLRPSLRSLEKHLSTWSPSHLTPH